MSSLTQQQEDELYSRLFQHIRMGGNTCVTKAGKKSEKKFLAGMKEIMDREIPASAPDKHGALLQGSGQRASH